MRRTKPIAARSVAAMSKSPARQEIGRVMLALSDMCDSLPTGSKIPTHKDLMQQYCASERTVLRALDELQRQRKLVRRHGSGTFVVHPETDPLEFSDNSEPTNLNAIVAIARPDQSFFDLCIELLYDHVRVHDLDLVCQLIGRNDDVDFVTLSARKAAGYIVFNYHYYADLAKQLLDAGNRVVIVGAPDEDEYPVAPSVYGDHAYGGYIAAKHLIDLGHRRLLFIYGLTLPEHSPRWSGINRAVAEAAKEQRSVTVDTLHFSVLDSWARDPQIARIYFGGLDSPTAVLSWNDHEAMSLISSLFRCGLKVPQDVSVIGYDCMPEGETAFPPLTTIDTFVHQMLDAAVRILTRPTAPPPSYSVVSLPRLVIRESTAPPRGYP